MSGDRQRRGRGDSYWDRELRHQSQGPGQFGHTSAGRNERAEVRRELGRDENSWKNPRNGRRQPAQRTEGREVWRQEEGSRHQRTRQNGRPNRSENSTYQQAERESWSGSQQHGCGDRQTRGAQQTDGGRQRHQQRGGRGAQSGPRSQRSKDFATNQAGASMAGASVTGESEVEERRRLSGPRRRREGSMLLSTALNAAAHAALSCRDDSNQGSRRILRQ